MIASAVATARGAWMTAIESFFDARLVRSIADRLTRFYSFLSNLNPVTDRHYGQRSTHRDSEIVIDTPGQK